MPQSKTAIKVIVAGGAYGGIAFAVNLLDLCSGKPARGDPDGVLYELARQGVPVDIHIIDERDGYLHLIGCPLAFASEEYAQKIWVKYDDVPALQHPSIRWSQGKVIATDPDRKTVEVVDSKTGAHLDLFYDYFVAATGLRRIYPVVPRSTSREQYVEETGRHAASVRNAADGVVVIGGGAVGIEMAAELKHVHPDSKVTLVHSRSHLLSAEPLPSEFKQAALEALREAGVEVVLGHGRVTDTVTRPTPDGKAIHKLVLQDGTKLSASHIINAVSQQEPCTEYLPVDCLNDEGLVKINNLLRYLPSSHSHYPHHYAIGDIAAWSGIKRCGAAMHMGFVAAVSMHKQILLERFQIILEFPLWPEVPPMMALALGKRAITYGPGQAVQCSEEQMRVYFAKDLGFTACWNHVKLGERPTVTIDKGLSDLPQTAPYLDMVKNAAIAT